MIIEVGYFHKWFSFDKKIGGKVIREPMLVEDLKSSEFLKTVMSIATSPAIGIMPPLTSNLVVACEA
ncbi:MAG TPA: hypothetical protein DCL66_14575 [Gammaproteobacteria bacterium]|nr:hypothetical protein [Gammaproteobacteria bacterium]